jgi:gamma-glutamyltranspeptidase/glutathione hydrolase
MHKNRDAFCLFFDAVTKKVKGLNGSGRSPKRLSLEHIRKRGVTGRHISLTDLNAVTVPGQPSVSASSCVPH